MNKARYAKASREFIKLKKLLEMKILITKIALFSSKFIFFWSQIYGDCFILRKKCHKKLPVIFIRNEACPYFLCDEYITYLLLEFFLDKISHTSESYTPPFVWAELDQILWNNSLSWCPYINPTHQFNFWCATGRFKSRLFQILDACDPLWW